MAPVKLQAKDVVFTVVQAILTVLRYSNNPAFITASLNRLKANTLQEAEQKLRQHLWSILHRHQDVEVPPEVAEEISSLPLQEHTAPNLITEEPDDFPDNEATTEFSQDIPQGIVYREEGYNDQLVFVPGISTECLAVLDHTGPASTGGASPGAELQPDILTKDNRNFQQPQSKWWQPSHSSTPIKPSHSNTRYKKTTASQVPVHLEVISEQTENTEMNSGHDEIQIIHEDEEVQLFEDSIGQYISVCSQDRDVYDNSDNYLGLSSIHEPTVSSPVFPHPGDFVDSRDFEEVGCDEGFVCLEDNDRDRVKEKIDRALSFLSRAADHKESSSSSRRMIDEALSGLSDSLAQSTSQTNVPQQQEKHITSQASPSLPHNSTQKSASLMVEDRQDVCDTGHPSQETTIIFHFADEFSPSRDKEKVLDSLHDNRNTVLDITNLSQDSTTVIFDANESWLTGEELNLSDIAESEVHETSQRLQMEVTNNVQKDSTNTDYHFNESSEHSSTTSSEETVSLDILITSPNSETVSLEAGAVLSDNESNGKISPVSYCLLTEDEVTSEFRIQNLTSSITESAICNSNKEVPIQDEGKIRCEGKSQLNSSLRTLGPSSAPPSQEQLPVIQPLVGKSISVSSQKTCSLSFDPTQAKDLLSSDKNKQDSSSEKTQELSRPPATGITVHRPDVPSLPVSTILTHGTPSKKLRLSGPDIITASTTATMTHPEVAVNKPMFQPSSKTVISFSGVPQVLPGHVTPNLRKSDDVIMKPTPEKVLSDLAGCDDVSQTSPQVSRQPGKGDQGITQLSLEQVSPDTSNGDKEVLQPSEKQQRELLEQCHLSRDVKQNEDKGSQTPSDQESVNCDESDDSESLLRGIEFDPVCMALSLVESFCDKTSSCESFPLNEQFSDPSILFSLSNNQSFEHPAEAKTIHTENTKCLDNKGFFDASVTTESVKPATNIPAVQNTVSHELASTSMISSTQARQMEDTKCKDLEPNAIVPKRSIVVPLNSEIANLLGEGVLPVNVRVNCELSLHTTPQDEGQGSTSHHDKAHGQVCGDPVDKTDSGDCVSSNHREFHNRTREVAVPVNNLSKPLPSSDEPSESTTHKDQSSAEQTPKTQNQDISLTNNLPQAGYMSQETKPKISQLENEVKEGVIFKSTPPELRGTAPGGEVLGAAAPTNTLSGISVLGVKASGVKRQEAGYTGVTMQESVTVNMLDTSLMKLLEIEFEEVDMPDEQFPQFTIPREVRERTNTPDFVEEHHPTACHVNADQLTTDVTMLDDDVQDATMADCTTLDATMQEEIIVESNSSAETMELGENSLDAGIDNQQDDSSDRMNLEGESARQQQDVTVAVVMSTDVIMLDVVSSDHGSSGSLHYK